MQQPKQSFTGDNKGKPNRKPATTRDNPYVIDDAINYWHFAGVFFFAALVAVDIGALSALLLSGRHRPQVFSS